MMVYVIICLTVKMVASDGNQCRPILMIPHYAGIASAVLSVFGAAKCVSELLFRFK